MFLVFLPAMRGRWRTAFIAVIAVLVFLIGLSRTLLGERSRRSESKSGVRVFEMTVSR